MAAPLQHLLFLTTHSPTSSLRLQEQTQNEGTTKARRKHDESGDNPRGRNLKKHGYNTITISLRGNRGLIKKIRTAAPSSQHHSHKGHNPLSVRQD
ncbi:MAG: hypothetical protein IJK84_07215 [Bacteroidales bacterium]|nr:hypothetical protein [Bacteroidales bacterium]